MVRKEIVSIIDSEVTHEIDKSFEDIAADFQRRYGDFAKLMERISKPMFDKFVTTVYEILRDNPYISCEEFKRRIKPEPIPIEPPISDSKSTKIFTDTVELSKQGLAREGTFPQSLLFRGTGSCRNNFDRDRPTRKLYCAPDYRQVPKFIKIFYATADTHSVNFMGSKFVGHAIKRNNERECVSQAHNTFVIYCASDSDVYTTLAALQCAEHESKVSLGSFKNSPLIKSPRALDNKVIIGGRDVFAPIDRWGKEDEDLSFDKWTELMAVRVHNYHEKKDEPYWSPGLAVQFRSGFKTPHLFARHVVFKIMRDVLKDVAQRTPEDYLCI